MLTIHAGLRVSELTADRLRRSHTRHRRARPRRPGKAAETARFRSRCPRRECSKCGSPNAAAIQTHPLFPTRTGRRLSRDAVASRLHVHVTTAAQRCETLHGKRVHPHVLRHSCAMALLQAGVDSTVIALWLGHADTSSTQPYIHADMTIKERALALLTPPDTAPGRYTPSDGVLRFLDELG